MAYVPDISGFLEPLGNDSNLNEILRKEVPNQLEFKYNKNDITEFNLDMHIVIKAEDGFRIRLLVNNRTVSVLLLRNISKTLRSFYNSKGYLHRIPVFEFGGESSLLCVCDKREKICMNYLNRMVKVKGSNEPVLLLRIWSDSTPSYIAPSKVELIPI